jgi:hypothetical protein
MTTSTDLVIYQPRISSSLTRTTYSSSLISSGLFSQQTGTAIVTELLYRILFDIINRFLVSLQRLASRGLDSASSFVERKLQERRDGLEQAKERHTDGLNIVDEVTRLARREGFVACPVTGSSPAPPIWIRSVLEGIENGRMHKEDFWTNQW